MSLRQILDVSLFQALRRTKCCDCGAVLLISSCLGSFGLHTRLWVQNSTDGIEVDMNVRPWPVDKTAILIDLERVPLIVRDGLHCRHLVERNFVAIQGARDDKQSIINDARIRNQFVLSSMKPSGKYLSLIH